jgi:F-type H+-transporting ATPase subunit gamma
LARYGELIDAQLAELHRLPDGPPGPTPGPGQRSVLVVISSERGLCGTFNQRLVEHVRADLKSKRAAGEDVDLVCLGRQGQRLLQTAGEPIVLSSPLTSFALPSYLDIEKAAVDILDLMEARRCGTLFVMHNAPQRRFQFQVTSRQLLPIAPFQPSAGDSLSTMEVRPASDIEGLFTQITTERVLIHLYQAVIESAISEELARVAAMRLATDNARRLLDQLSQEASRARQEAETNALLEIISGFRAATTGDGVQSADLI